MQRTLTMNDTPLATPVRSGAGAVERKGPGMNDGRRVVRVLCVDDHAVLVEGLRAQFEVDGRLMVIGRLATASRLPEEVARAQPDVVLLDIELPGPDVFEMADRLHHERPTLPIVFLSAHVRDGYLAAAYKCGASGYFAKGDSLESIVSGLLEAARQGASTFVLGPLVRERCAITAGRPGGHDAANGTGDRSELGPSTRLASLSARELEVLRLIGKGLSRTEIATELSRSAKTIDGHQERILKKLRVDTRSELMRFAIREGLAEA
jgi:DNA-binding NarL/FixJ family response regulator